MERNKKLFIVIPCYNEEEAITITTKVLTNKLDKLIKDRLIDNSSKILYVDDGSKDKTWSIIEDLHKTNKYVTGLKLSKNRGHQNALLAGLMYSKEHADVTISMDADLQDDINVIDKMIDDYLNGCEIVFGVRSARKKDSFFKKWTAESFYKFMKIMGADIVYNHADYRLMSKKALETLSEFKEVNLFLRGLVKEIGYKTSIVYYERDKRIAGVSKYPLKKMIKFAIDGITSFSIKPLKLITTLGFIMLIISFGVLIYSIIRKLTGNTIEGWTFIVVSIWFVSSIQLLSLGVIGEYIGKIYSEVKARPRYIIEEELI